MLRNTFSETGQFLTNHYAEDINAVDQADPGTQEAAVTDSFPELVMTYLEQEELCFKQRQDTRQDDILRGKDERSLVIYKRLRTCTHLFISSAGKQVYHISVAMSNCNMERGLVILIKDVYLCP